ncbi:ATP-binding protein [Streptomyces sp. NPDC054796]
MPSAAGRCEACGAELPARSPDTRPKPGRPARYCSSACRQRAYRRRTSSAAPTPATAPAPPPSPSPVVRSAPRAAGRIAAPLDSFVGRTRELREAGALLEGYRLVTLTGPGGAGKTRLAVELALRVRPRYGDGVWLVELAPLMDGTRLADTVAGRLGVLEEAGRPVADTLAEALAGHRSLLVLDNCEHLVREAAGFTERLLRHCPGLRVLATSRESLDVPGEAVFRVPELSLPERAGSEPPETSEPSEPTDPSASRRRPAPRADAASDAVRLFVERAAAVAPDFVLTRANSRAVADICTRLDGMPLAIELAARRVRLLPVAEISARLDDRFRLLTSGARTADARHQDLRTTIEWSHDLLEPAEQALLRRLSVLVGGFGVESATAVGADGNLVEPGQVLGLLAGLESRSLIVPERDAARGRFRQLESIRLYARELLDGARETDAVMERLVSRFVTLAEPVAGDAMLHCYQELEPLDAEKPSLDAALEWCAGRGDTRRLALAAALGRCWRHHGHFSRGHALLTTALAESAADHPCRGAALEQVAALAAARGLHAEAGAAAAEAERLAAASGGPVPLGRALNTLALVQLAEGRAEDAFATAGRCLRLVEPLGRPLDTAVYLHNRAWFALQCGRTELADQLMRRCLPMYRAHSPHPLPPEWSHTAGVLALAVGDVAHAEERLREGLRTYLPPSAYASTSASASPSASTDSAPAPASAVSGVLPVVGIELLEGLAIAAAGSGRPLRALRLASAAEAVRRTRRIRAAGSDGADGDGLKRALAHARVRLAAAEAARATAEGARQRLPEVLRYAVDGVWEVPSVESVPLTAREIEAALLVTEGYTNRQIASRLHISERTVEAHLASIRTRIGLRSRAQLASWAVRHLDDGALA